MLKIEYRFPGEESNGTIVIGTIIMRFLRVGG